MEKKRYICISVILALLCSVLCFGGCAAQEENEAELGVVATVFPAYDFARNIAGDRLPVELLVPPGSESHSYEPSARDIRLINSWQLICNGGESESWLQELLEAEQPRYEPLYMMNCVETVQEEYREGMQLSHPDHEQDESSEHDHGEEMEYDEHVWTSPVNAIVICQAICDRLCNIDPEGSDYYRSNLSAYTEKLNDLDARFREVVQSSERGSLIFADRFPVRYFVEEYGLEYYAAFPGCAEEAEPSARTVAFLIDKVREEQTPAVLYIEFSNQMLADVICEDTGCKKLLFHSCHNVTTKQLDEGVSYLELMENNLLTLREALG